MSYCMYSTYRICLIVCTLHTVYVLLYVVYTLYMSYCMFSTHCICLIVCTLHTVYVLLYVLYIQYCMYSTHCIQFYLISVLKMVSAQTDKEVCTLTLTLTYTNTHTIYTYYHSLGFHAMQSHTNVPPTFRRKLLPQSSEQKSMLFSLPININKLLAHYIVSHPRRPVP